MQSIKAVYDGTDFLPMQPIPVIGQFEVIITYTKPIKNERKVKLPRSEVIGLLKGKVWMAEDFNAPLEELEEYME